MWEVAEAVGDKALEEYLRQGWEPIGAQRVDGPPAHVVWFLRRPVFGPGFHSTIELADQAPE